MKFTKEELNNEVWRDVIGFEDTYQISNLGRFKSKEKLVNARSKDTWYKRLRKEKIRNPSDNGGGYKRVTVCYNGKSKTLYIHRLVAEAFLCNPNNLKQVNHKDFNKSNNKASNLEWCTSKENIWHRITNRGCPTAVKVTCLDLGKTYNSIAEAARMTNSDYASIGACLSGRYKTANGMRWVRA